MPAFQSIPNELRILHGTWMISMQTKRINPNDLTAKVDSFSTSSTACRATLFRRLDDRIGLSA
jgi:hypothetical protein